MANRLKGITLEIGGDTTDLSKSLKGVNSEIKDTQTQLKDVEKLLKLDPTNVELLKQKEKLLNDEVGETKTKLDELKKAQASMDTSGVEKNSSEYMALQREIIATENELENLESAASRSNTALSEVSAVADKVATATGKVADKTKGLSTAAAGVITGLAGAAYSSVTAADDLNTLAKQTGFTTAELQEMQYASDLIDVSVDDITSGAAKLKKNMTSTSTSVTEAFDTLGISVTDANGNMRDSNEVFWETIQALSEVDNETERDQLAMALLGKGADSLAGIIDDGGEAFRNLANDAEEAGLILDQDTLNSLNAVNDQIDTLKATASATLAETGAKAMEALMPVFEKIVSGISEVLDWIGKLDESQITALLSVLAVVAAISPVFSIISKISSAISLLTGTIIPALSTALSFLAANPIVLVIAAIVALIAAIVKFGDKIQAVLNKVDTFLKNVFTQDFREIFGDTLGTVLNGFYQSVYKMWQGIKSILDGIIDFIKGVFSGDWERAWKGVKEIFTGIFETLATAFKTPVNAVITIMNAMIRKINGLLGKVKGVASKVGLSIGTLNEIPLLAKGGSLISGSAIVGEAGPELLTVSGGRTVVQPLTATVDTAGLSAALSGNSVTQVNVAFTGSLAQLASVLQPVITAETARRGGSLVRT